MQKPSIIQTNIVDKPIAIFSDFDGTIFLQDTGHILFDNFGCGKEKREELDGSIGKTKSFREASEEMWGSLNVTFDDGLKALSENLVIDKDFEKFLNYCNQRNIPFNVISAGLKPLLRGALEHFLGKEKSANIDVVSNDGEISESGDLWQPVWRHDCELGHDKAQSIKEFRDSVKGEQPLLVFIGDGVSDLAAAKHADVLFARKGLKLEQYCVDHKIPYIPYNSFADIQTELEGFTRNNPYHDNINENIKERVADGLITQHNREQSSTSISSQSSIESLEWESPTINTIPSSPATPAVEPPLSKIDADYAAASSTRPPLNLRTVSAFSTGGRKNGQVDENGDDEVDIDHLVAV